MRRALSAQVANGVNYQKGRHGVNQALWQVINSQMFLVGFWECHIGIANNADESILLIAKHTYWTDIISWRFKAVNVIAREKVILKHFMGAVWCYEDIGQRCRGKA